MLASRPTAQVRQQHLRREFAAAGGLQRHVPAERPLQAFRGRPGGIGAECVQLQWPQRLSADEPAGSKSVSTPQPMIAAVRCVRPEQPTTPSAPP